ncbi:MAG: hypothetical protein IPJ65_26980 [Archangiaceae bacterium]|nr:hypothetical protein [Archangiaceae bacterium]
MRAAWLVLPLVVVGCAGMEENVRTERGPLLRSFERPRVVEGGVSGKVSVEPSGAKLTLELEGYDTCRTEKVEEYAETRFTSTAAWAGAGLKRGVSFTGAAAILLGVSYALSGEPGEPIEDRRRRQPRAPPRILARNWSIALFCIGIPTLGAGLFQFLRTGEEVETVKVEQVASQHDETCNVRRIDGPVFVRAWRAGRRARCPPAGRGERRGRSGVNADIDAFLFYEREVVLDDASVSLLHAFNGCGRLEREAVAEPAALSTGVLLKRLEAARACRQVRGDAVAAEQARLEAELLKPRGWRAGHLPAGREAAAGLRRGGGGLPAALHPERRRGERRREGHRAAQRSER